MGRRLTGSARGSSRESLRGNALEAVGVGQEQAVAGGGGGEGIDDDERRWRRLKFEKMEGICATWASAHRFSFQVRTRSATRYLLMSPSVGLRHPRHLKELVVGLGT
jgi:hypothetical protein